MISVKYCLPFCCTALLSCESISDIKDGYPTVRVVGRVVDGAGLPVAPSMVAITSYNGSCSGSASTYGTANTDANGRYRGGFPTPGLPFTGCVKVTVTAGVRETFPPITVRRDSLSIAEPATDSLVVNFVVVRP
ncbi:hypothetical protein [Gemmatimonas sp.]|uniref:hypothetical protein n=1 Tax=Gemmatimonas sp. TaxID=1962908 RepID=UPI00286C70A6|nr:hypothetical protein [Gemmatimonas sp.]